MRHRFSSPLLAGLLLAWLACAGPGQARPAHKAIRWVGAWAASQQAPEPQNALAPEDLQDATLRQIVHLSAGGTELRVRVSNAFGAAPLHVTAVHVARALSPAGARVDSATDRTLSFSGKPEITVPAGAEYWSDPIAFPTRALTDLAISFHTGPAPAQQTSHPGSRATSYLIRGDQAAAPDLPGARRIDHWFQVSGVDVAGGEGRAAVVTLGDSITDGHGATTNGNDRWPDVLARRLQAGKETRALSVLNEGIGGNRLLQDGLGPNALARFDRDVLAQSGVRALIVLEGVNDLGTLTRDKPVSPEEHAALVARMIGAYSQIAARARAHGVKAIGATLLPYAGSDYYHPDAANEADRQAVNAWIRAPGHFDAVIDFDRVTRDPKHPDRLLPAYDSGDHLHPSPAGYRAMAQAIPLKVLSR